ncbi:MAG: MobF family relaxase, partial [Sciscionella sp.]
MSLHKLTAGPGYDYLTRQVAVGDATDKGHTGLASYYTERGEAPGTWVGSGMAGIEGLAAGDAVTAEQMKALFGEGHHPLADQRQAAARAAHPIATADSVAAEATAIVAGEQPSMYGRSSKSAERARDRAVVAAANLGKPYPVHHDTASPFRRTVAARLEQFNVAAGLPRDWPVPAEQRARIRTEVAAEFFRAEHGRDPANARELAGVIAKQSRPKNTAVAGYDLTFSPVKSVSVLWALADPATAATIERAHRAAISGALGFIEAHALYTREGAGGVRQVEVTGLVATAFTHRDSRAGDPDLHTHVAVANKVQTHAGRWLAIDGRVLYKAAVAASETYNTALETHLCAALGVRFAERPGQDPRKRPVREVLGVDDRLAAAFSKRSGDIEVRRGALATEFQSAHGRPPTPIESVRLAQQATLETRQAKHEPRTLAEQRTCWHDEATAVLGS